MKNNDNIEQLFKDSLGNLEAEVRPSVWTGVQSKMGASGASAAAGGKLLIAAAVTGAAILAGGLWYFTSQDQKTESQAPSITQEQPVAEISSPVSISDPPASALSNTPASEQTASGVSSPENSAASSVPATPSYVSPGEGQSSGEAAFTETSEPSGPTTTASRYGNAPRGDGGMMRYNRQDNQTSGSQNENTEDRAASPTAKIFANTISGDAPLTVDFQNQGSEGSVTWEFNDGTSSRQGIVTHTFTKAGAYDVTLTVRNSAGQSSDKITIEVRQISAITFTPNVFTPNGDGENDEFHIETRNMANVSVIIFNRKGEKVAAWSVAEGSWNGKLPNGSDAPADNYFYILRGVGIDGVSHTEKGDVSLMR